MRRASWGRLLAVLVVAVVVLVPASAASAKTLTATGYIPDPSEGAGATTAAEGVAADKNGVIYGAEVGPRALKRYVKQ